jgi:NAD(P)-dependent dehydrogenase (short-subunit alcohol dehydrogenase family)
MQELRFDNAVAVVTGAGGGLGRRYAIDLAKRGASVVVNDVGADLTDAHSDLSPAQKVVAGITAAGGNAVASGASVATPEGGQSIIDTAMNVFGRVDIVINNAGILRPQPFAELDFDVLNAVIDVHLMGAFHVAKPAFQVMQGQGSGTILNASSGAVFGVAAQTNYGAAKGGLIGLTRGLAIEGAEHNIRTNAIMPVATTRMTEDFFTDGLDKLLVPDFVAPLVCWLVHPQCSANGEIFSVGGGHVARVFLGETAGWTLLDLDEHTPEAVRDNFGLITDTTSYSTPASFWEEMDLMVKAITSQTASPQR